MRARRCVCVRARVVSEFEGVYKHARARIRKLCTIRGLYVIINNILFVTLLIVFWIVFFLRRKLFAILQRYNEFAQM